MTEIEQRSLGGEHMSELSVYRGPHDDSIRHGVGTVLWDDRSDASNPGWVVLTATAGWQPIEGDRETSDIEVVAAASAYLNWSGEDSNG